MNKVAVIRKVQFNAAHRLHNPQWNEEKNKSIFGACNHPNYHGHNYTLEVKVCGVINPKTGFVIDLKVLKHIIQEEIIERFDHKNLNLDTKEFKHINPTAENIAVVIHQILVKKIPPAFDLFIRLYETPRNFVEYPV